MNELIYIILIVMLVLVIFFIILLFKQRTYLQNQIETLLININKQSQENQNFVSELSKDLGDNFVDKFYYLNKSIGNDMANYNQLLSSSLNSKISNIDEIFKNMLDKISKIENSAQLSLGIKDEIIKLNRIFSNQKLRGTFGEQQLEKVIELTYGDNKNFYELQKKLSNGKIADCILKVKDDKLICIDSKFPLLNYQKFCSSIDEKEQNFYKNELKKDMKKHINDVSSKYIIQDETTDYAVIFIPSEAVFVFVCSNMDDIMDYANKSCVFLSSPTTLMSLLYSLRLFIRDENIAKNVKTIKNEILVLNSQFQTHLKYCELLDNQVEKLHKQIKFLKEDSQKIQSSFDNFKNLS